MSYPSKPNGIALICAAIFTVLFSVPLILFKDNTWLILIAVIGFFLLSFLTVLYLVKRFIHEKIKLVYKSISSVRSGEESFKFNLLHDDDPLKTANSEVAIWAANQSEMIKELKEREKFRKEFLGNISHELKTPIFNIQGYLHTLLDGALYDEKVNQDFLLRASRSADRLDELVEDLLMISRLERDVEPKKVRFELVKLIKDVFSNLEFLANKSHISLKLEGVGDKSFWVMGEENSIQQVIQNLVVNAINYGNENGNVSIAIHDMDENLLVEVKDDGLGIEESEIPRLFERFYRVDKSRSRNEGGTGLGLAIVKHVLEAHGQTIDVKSTLGVGSVFNFTLAKA